MLIEHKREEKMCCFYVSDFHLEMILLPYINRKIEENEKIIIKTEKDLKNTLEVLISKMNLDNDNKEKILNLGWNIKEDKKIEDKSNVIIIGDKKYIEDVNNQIKQKNAKDINVVDCYNFEDTKEEMSELLNLYNGSLNTCAFRDI